MLVYKGMLMLTAEDKEDIRRIVAETLLAKLADSSNEERSAQGRSNSSSC